MKTRPRIVALVLASLLAGAAPSAFAAAQAAPSHAASTAAKGTSAMPARTRAYIDHAWGVLTRSIDNCSALRDPKIATRPVIYLPHDLPMPAQVARARTHCGVDVHRLPRAISRLGDIDSASLPVQGLLYVPRPYVVPGGQFNEMYGWDSYFILLGLVADHHDALARDMVDNALFEVAHYGGVLNANRTYYLSRSQPPLLSQMMTEVLGAPGAFDSVDERHAWLASAYPLAVRNYQVWTRAEHQAGKTGLARYFDLGHGPVPEMHGSAYYQGVIRWLRAHPSQDPGYLVKASEHPKGDEVARLKKSSCDVAASKVCAGAWADGYRLSADYYLGDRAMRESGFDTNFHFGPYGGSTHHYAPVGLNSLLYRYERDLHDFALQLGRMEDANRWAEAAARRMKAMDTYLWQPSQGMYMDYDFVAGKPATQPYLTTFYPLWAGAASPEQAAAVDGKLPLFERKGGLAMDNRASGAQWDEPFGWAPTNWLAISGLKAYDFNDDARRLARKFTDTVDRSLAKDGTIREKYNMVLGNAEVKITAGYTQNVIGFGWTNAVYLKLQQLLHGNAAGPAAASSVPAPVAKHDVQAAGASSD